MDDVITKYEKLLSINRIRKNPPNVSMIDMKASIIKALFHFPVMIEFFSKIKAVKKNIKANDMMWL